MSYDKSNLNQLEKLMGLEMSQDTLSSQQDGNHSSDDVIPGKFFLKTLVLRVASMMVNLDC